MSQKVSDKEVQKAMQTFNAVRQFPMGMMGPMASMIPSAVNSYNPYQASNPFFQQPQVGMLPTGQPVQMTPEQVQMVTAQQALAYQSQMNQPMMPQQGYKTIGMQGKIRLGIPKKRVWGKCADCSHYQKTDDQSGFCVPKQERTKPAGGLVTTKITTNGKTEELVDATKSCRLFKKFE